MWITVRLPSRMKNGGFSTTSWPTTRIRSAAAIARCTKSPSDSAAQPSHSGWCSSTTPLPICVVKNGTPSVSTKRLSMRALDLRLAPAPIISSGRCALASARRARAMAFSSHTGRRDWLAGSRIASLSSRAMSSGSSRCTAPGRSSAARRQASRTLAGIASADTICRVYLVSGCIMSTTSTIWNAPCLLLRMGFCPVIISIGIAPSCA